MRAARSITAICRIAEIAEVGAEYKAARPAVRQRGEQQCIEVRDALDAGVVDESRAADFDGIDGVGVHARDVEGGLVGPPPGAELLFEEFSQRY